jgi:hypothetical protein
MGRSVVLLERCHLSSIAGFGVWSKHQGHIVMRSCMVSDVGRTGVAVFNESLLVATDCDILRAGVHGVCVRHSTIAELTDIRITDSRARGVYVYNKANMSMLRCVVTGTQKAMPAVQVFATEPADGVTFRMEACRVHGNTGLGLRIEGCVDFTESDNVLEGVLIDIEGGDRSGEGRVDAAASAVPGLLTVAESPPTIHSP